MPDDLVGCEAWLVTVSAVGCEDRGRGDDRKPVEATSCR